MIRFLTFFLLLTKFSFAQLNNSLSKQVFEDGVENSANEINESEQNEIPSELMDLLHHPININSDNTEILIRYNLLTKSQLTSLEEYKNKIGDLIELEELQQVEGFDKKTIQTIIPFCTITKLKTEQRLQQIVLRAQRSFDKTDETNPGSDSKILFRYRAVLSSSFNVSFTGEKDAGEEIFTRNQKGFDFNSFNILYKGKSIIKKIIIGDYNLEFGQGLTAWTGLSFGSGTNITGIYKFGRGLIPYSGTDENRFLRGIAATFQKNKLKFDSWVSYHAIDANKETDSISNESYITSLQTSGYHRTLSEIQDKHSQQERILGSAISFSNRNLTSGIIVLFQHFNLPIQINTTPYKKFEFNGNENFNVGWHYSYSFKNIFFFGESAVSKNNSFATLNGSLLSIDPRFSIGFLWRSYSKSYIALKSNAFGINTNNSNERGNYFGIIYKLNRTLTYNSYIDIYSFPFLKYRIDKPSHGFDFFHQLEYVPSKKFTGQIRYRKRLKELNEDDILPGSIQLSDLAYDNIRISARFKIDNAWEYSFRIEYISESVKTKLISYGTLISQDIFFHPMGKPYSANCRYAVFNCPQFDTRIYEYENDVQGAFSIPFYYGRGSRFYTNLNFKIKGGITFSLRYAVTWIDDSTTTLEKSEIKLQLSCVFK